MRACLIAVLTLLTPAVASVELKVTRAHCEYAQNPLGIDVAKPRLGWVLESPKRGQHQTAYQVLVSTSLEKLNAGQADLWDSGKVVGPDSINIEYGGKDLGSGQRVWWKIRAWSSDDQPSAYSEPAWWETALLVSQDWKAKWICDPRPLPADVAELYAERPAPMFRKPFDTSKKIARARAYVTGLGYYELYLNGKRVGDRVLDPGWTTYSKRVLYSTFDVTDLLRVGKNCAGAMVGNGWYNPLPLRLWGGMNIRDHLTTGRPRFLMQLEIEYVDGTREQILSDETWKTADSPILKNSVYLGEVYDARREQSGWSEPGFDDAAWKSAALSTEPIGRLQAQCAPPIRITRTLKPVKLTEPKPDVWIFDFGQNFAGWVRLHAQAPAGTALQLRYGELLNPDGSLNVMTSVCGQIKSKGMGGPGAPDVAYQSETYICRGGDSEVYTPRFTFHGFRYAELTGSPGKPELDTLEGLRLNADVEQVGAFECSDALFNRIHEIVQWTLLSNLFSVQSDCPHREKLGYGGDIVASCEMAMFNYDMAQFYAKAVRDLEDAARPNGGLTETAPFVGIADGGFGEGTSPIEWGTGHPVLLRQLYEYYGNRRLIDEQYAVAKRWVDFLESKAPDAVVENGIGDHETIVPKLLPVTGTAFYFYNARLLSELAGILGRAEDKERYARLAETIRDAFNRKNLNPETGAYGPAGQESQCGQAIALYLGLVPAAKQSSALKVLTDDVSAKHKGHLTTGIFGTKFMLDILSELAPEVAYTIVGQKDFPGWGHMIEGGATTLWEHWEYSDNTYSHNHPMFGSVDEWLYRTVGGINPSRDAVGFDKVVIRPRPGGGVTWARATYRSCRGTISTDWKIDDGRFTLRVHIPVGAKAEIDLPATKGATITEGGQPANAVKGVVVKPGERDTGAVFAIGSGEYEFVVKP